MAGRTLEQEAVERVFILGFRKDGMSVNLNRRDAVTF